MTETRKVLNIKQLAEYIGVSRRSLYNMLSDGRFPVQPIPESNPRRWLAENVDAWLRGGK